jgi:hypothetical protein
MRTYYQTLQMLNGSMTYHDFVIFYLHVQIGESSVCPNGDPVHFIETNNYNTMATADFHFSSERSRIYRLNNT